MSSFEKDGYWFIPGNPDQEIFGRLSFSPEKPAKLFLADQFQLSESIEKSINGNNFEVINGYFLDGREVTLVDCFQKKGFKSGVQTAEIFVKYVITGHQFETKSAIKLSSVSARYSLLEEWVLSSSFSISWGAQSEDFKHEIIMKQSITSPIELGVLSSFSVFLQDLPWIPIEHLKLLSFLGEMPTKFPIEEKKSILLKSDEERNLEEFIDSLILFQDFLLFCTGEIINVYDVISFIVVKKQKPKIPNPIELGIRLGTIKPENVISSPSGFVIKEYGEAHKATTEEVLEEALLQIYFSTGTIQDEERKLNRVNALIMFHEIKDKMPSVLHAWETNKQDVGSIFDLYLRLTYIPERHVDDLFLTISQAVEAFHRVCHERDKFDDTLFDGVREAMIKAIPKAPSKYSLENNEDSAKFIAELKDFIENKLRYINEFSLKERLLDLCDRYKNCFPDRLFEQGEIESFSKQVRDTRGSLTHISKSSKRKRSGHIISREERRGLTKKLLTLLQACLIKQLGLDDVEVKRILSRR